MAENQDQATDNLDQQDTQETQDTQQTLNTETQDWKTNLSDEYKQDPTAEKFKDVNSLFKSYKSLQGKIGKDKVVVPGEGASKEEKSSFFSQIGRPDTPNDYKISDETMNKVPPEFRNEDEQKEFNKVAHKAGLTGQQYNLITDWHFDQTGQKIGKIQQEKEQSKQKGENALRKEWGKAFDSKLQLGERALNEYGNDKAREKLTKARLNNDPDIIKLLSNAGEGLSEDTISGKPTGSLMTPGVAQREVAKIMGDMKHPYWKKDHPEHKFAVQRVEQLNQMAHPE